MAQNYQKLQQLMHDSARQNGRAENTVRLIAVSKGQPAEKIGVLAALGQRRFGENRVQEAQQKFADLRAQIPDLELHLIGPLQTNKAKAAVLLFDVIETIDRPELVAALAKAVQLTGRRPRFFVQVNIGREPQKAGVLPEALGALLQQCQSAGLTIEGLMCIPPAGEEPDLHFAKLASLAREHSIYELSMGMSGDYPQAIAHGATYIRVGTGLFGARSL